MKASAFTLARLTRDLITIARTTRVIAITVTPTNIGGAAGTGGIIGTTTIGTTMRIDEPSAKSAGAVFLSNHDRRKDGLTDFRIYVVDDPVAFILAQNIRRSKGQQAMAVAKAMSIKYSQREMAEKASVSQAY